jgi:PAS domain S-box-containing protein
LKPARRRRPAGLPSLGAASTLRARLAEAGDTLRALVAGELDTVVVPGQDGPRRFSLEGAEHAYRGLIESMNEGALTLTADKTILYANRCFARMVKCPLEQVPGSSFRRFLSSADRATLRPLMHQPSPEGTKTQVQLKACDGSQLSVQISLQPLAQNDSDRATMAMVVTDVTEARRTEEMLRALTRRVVEVQEAERGRVALELHDHITQLLCGVLFRSQALAATLSATEGPAKREAADLRQMLAETAGEVERISRNLRPSVLEHLGLLAVLHDTGTEFSIRTGVPVKLACEKGGTRLGQDSELALYRILQEALSNVEKHARARLVTVGLRRRGAFVELLIEDDGIGFDPEHPPARDKASSGLGLVSMRERASYVGGVLKIRSVRYVGTAIRVWVPQGPALGLVEAKSLN